jgi:hypothetical protein
VFTNWPVAALGGGESSEVSDARATVAADASANDSAAAASVSAAAGAAKSNAAANTATRAGAKNAATGKSDLVDNGGAELEGTPAGAPTEAGSPGAQGGGSSPSTSAQSQNPSAPSNDSSSSSGGGGGSSGGGSSGGSASTPTGQVTETVNGTVNKVDETVLGGTLHETGVTEVTEGVVNGVVGPESTVGHVLDETLKGVGGLLNGNH